MIKPREVLEKTSNGVSLVAGIAFGLAVLTTCTCIIIDNVRKLLPSKRGCVGIIVAKKPEPAKCEEAPKKESKPKAAPKKKSEE